MLLLSAEAAFKPGGPFLGEFTSEDLSQGFIPGRPSLAYKGCGYSIFCTELSVGIIGIYGIGSHASYSHIHELLLHADAVLQAYTFVESLEREVFDERYAVYLYVVDLRAELDGLCFLASYNGTYIMTVNADDTVTLSSKPSFFFSCSMTDRTPLHSCICCGDVLCQAPHNACRCICRAIQGFPKGVSCQ